MKQLATKKRVHGKSYMIDIFNDPFNKRVRLDDIQGDIKGAIEEGERIAVENKAEKLIAIARKEQSFPLLEKGFQCEGVIDGYFLGSDGYFFCKYFSSSRKESRSWIEEDELLRKVQLEKKERTVPPLPVQYSLKRVGKEDAKILSSLYKQVFQIYPTPLHDPEYVRKTMEEGAVYFGVYADGIIVSAASADINSFYLNAELTDCATLPDHRKHHLMKILLHQLEEHLRQNGIYCAYSLARAQSYGMNKVLHQLGYTYRGRLKNNCYIFDKIENMNVWTKMLV